MMGCMSKKPEDAAVTPSELGRQLSKLGASKGGLARAKGMTPQERSDRARMAVEARWRKAGKDVQTIPRATHEGPLMIGNLMIDCAVLDDGTRLVSENAFSKAIDVVRGGYQYRKRSREGEGDLPIFMTLAALKPFISDDLRVRVSSPVWYIPRTTGEPARGIDATVIPDVCNVWMEARTAQALSPRGIRTAELASVILRGLATVGIVALVDEATGYQDLRARDALAKILEAFVQKELRKWVKTFPPEFYKEMFRLRNLPYTGTVKSPRYIGHLTNDIVYGRLAPGVLEELKRLTPKNESGNPKHKLHQHLTEQIGHPKLLQHLASVTTLMRASDDWETFKGLLDRALPVYVPTPLFDGLENNYGEAG